MAPKVSASMTLRSIANAMRALHRFGHGLAGADLLRQAERIEECLPSVLGLERFHAEMTEAADADNAEFERADATADLANHLRNGGRLS